MSNKYAVVNRLLTELNHPEYPPISGQSNPSILRGEDIGKWGCPDREWTHT